MLRRAISGTKSSADDDAAILTLLLLRRALRGVMEGVRDLPLKEVLDTAVVGTKAMMEVQWEPREEDANDAEGELGVCGGGIV